MPVYSLLQVYEFPLRVLSIDKYYKTNLQAYNDFQVVKINKLPFPFHDFKMARPMIVIPEFSRFHCFGITGYETLVRSEETRNCMERTLRTPVGLTLVQQRKTKR